MYKTQLSFASTFFSTTQQAHAMEKYYGKQHSILQNIDNKKQKRGLIKRVPCSLIFS